jgi:hypothetical protein
MRALRLGGPMLSDTAVEAQARAFNAVPTSA